MGKWLISGLEQEMDKISLEYLVPKSKKGIRDYWGLVKSIQQIRTTCGSKKILTAMD